MMALPAADRGGATVTVTPEMLAAAWATWRPRHGGRIGPGPAFTEALRAGIEARPLAGAATEIHAVSVVLEDFGFPPAAWDRPSVGIETALTCLIRARNELFARALKAEAEVARLMRTVGETHDADGRAALSARYGAPSTWSGPYPSGWMHPPSWPADRTPTPAEAAMHDNGVFDAWRAIRNLRVPPTDGDPINPCLGV